ncbi:MAG: hypothetical protein AAGE43_10265, partial [Pseudomonadota bacterium]
MLTKADDYPIHQTPEPAAYSGTDRNFYDRYFFNGYERDGDLFFAAALGVYPHLNVMDAAFSFIIDGVQHNVYASKVLHMERLDTRVGPVGVEVLEPLQTLRLSIDDDATGLSGELTFEARFPAIEEPRFTRRVGSQTSMDYTRLTQNGTWSGEIRFQEQSFSVDGDKWWGTRDRSWGIRPIGARDPQQNPYARAPQFFWLWAPLNFDDEATFYHLNADESGAPWNTAGRRVSSAGLVEPAAVNSALDYAAGTRHAAAAELSLGEASIRLTPRQTFFMKGIGYGHPEWAHGHFHGELATGHDSLVLSEVDLKDPT